MPSAYWCSKKARRPVTCMLADLQAGFIDALKRPEAPVPDTIGKKGGKPVKRRFDVYRNNVVVGIIEALRATYPAIDKLVGEEFFAASARVYIDQHPPQSPLLFRYGATFGDFLDDFPPAASTPYLGDVARLEWARLEAYHARDCQPLSIDVLSDFLKGGDNGEPDVGTLYMALHPSLALISSRWPIVSLWAASTGLAGNEEVDLKRSERAMVIRPALVVETRHLPVGSFAFMLALRDGETLQQATLAANDADADFDLAEHLKGLFAVGAVSAINHQAP